MALGHNRRAVGVFSNRQDTERALRELRESNFPMDRVSVITRDADRRDHIAGADVRSDVREEARERADDTKADEGATTGAIAGGTLGGLTGLLVGLGTLAIPGIGPIMLAGATATALATTLAGTAIGAAAGSLLGGLIGLGIPEDRARAYHDRVSRGDYLIIVDGTDDEIRHAEAILHRGGIEDWGVYDHPDAAHGVGHHHRAVGVFSHRRDADAALDDLRDAGFPMSQLSFIARDYDRRDRIQGLTVRDRFDNSHFRFPEERYHFFHDRFNRGEYLVVVDGTEDEVRRAEAILRRHHIQNWELLGVPHTGHAHHVTPGTTRHDVGHHRRAVGVFHHRRDAEAAIRDLHDSGFPMNQISLVGRDTDGTGQVGDITDRTKTDEGAKGGAATGAALGGLGGLLVGLGALAIPGVGPVIAGGALATALATAATGGAIGAAAGGVTGALVGLGIPDDRARFYNDRVNRGDYLVMVDGTEDEIRRAEAILRRHHIHDWDIFDAPADRGVHERAHDRRDYVAAGTSGRDPNHRYRAVGVFPHHRDAEAAVRELHNSGFPMSQISLVGKHTPGEARIGDVADRTMTDEGAKGGAATGAALGGLGGLLVGLGALAIPGIGPVIAGGALATALATTAAGGAIGAAAGGLTGALVGLGIPDDRARFYNDRVNRGDYLVMVDGTEDEIRRAETLLSRRGIQDWAIFDAPAGDRSFTEHHTHTTPASRPAGTVGTVVGRHKHAVGVFPTRGEAEYALNELRDAGFPLSQVSLVVPAADRNYRFAGVNTLDRMDNYAHYGIFDDRASVYRDRLSRGNYMVLVNGTDDEIARAHAILNRRGIQEFGIYDPTQVSASRQVIEPDRPGVVGGDPNVVIVDHRDQTL